MLFGKDDMEQGQIGHFFAQIKAIIDGDKPAQYKLDNLVLNAVVIRCYSLVQDYIKKHGPQVYAGPLQGMLLPEGLVTPFLLSRYIGSYEHELHPAITGSVARGYDAVLNIGCAEGYYAVGLARLLADAQVFAYDILPDARAKCAALAAANGVADRLTVGELFRTADFAGFAGRRTLLFCDIEGGEFGLLDPAQAPALRDMDIIIELHERLPDRDPDAFCARFADSHDIIRIDHARGYDGPLPDRIGDGLEMDIYLAALCFREGRTPWAWMRSRSLPPRQVRGETGVQTD
jgi:SAM-dependent methyltransferase